MTLTPFEEQLIETIEDCAVFIFFPTLEGNWPTLLPQLKTKIHAARAAVEAKRVEHHPVDANKTIAPVKERLAEALRRILDEYIDLADSHYTGSYSTETDPFILTSRAALKAYEEERR